LNNKEDKCVVVHAGARDHYQLALALAERQYLSQLVTELYCPDSLTGILPGLAAKRYCKGLSSKLVSLSPTALWLTGKMAVQKSFAFNQQKDAALSERAYRLARKRQSHLFCYSYYAFQAFSHERAFSGQRRLLFQLHPHPASVRATLEAELERVPAARDSIQYENEFRYSQDYLAQLGAEAQLADRVLVASSYTKQTLVENGVAENRVQVVPYGIDSHAFSKRNIAPTNKKLRVIFIGSMVQRKGLSYLLDAARTLSSSVELVLCGRGFMDGALLDQYRDVDIVIKRNLSQQELTAQIHQADVFVLPTLSEGFAHVILEAMSCGLPVITTGNSCAPDVITDGKEGFIIPVKSSEALIAKLEWCVQHKNELFDMGQLAASRAALFTWQRFRKGIIDFYESSIHS
jgi:glycosyltransferase involved in cell wall biosynthesis